MCRDDKETNNRRQDRAEREEDGESGNQVLLPLGHMLQKKRSIGRHRALDSVISASIQSTHSKLTYPDSAAKEEERDA